MQPLKRLRLFWIIIYLTIVLAGFDFAAAQQTLGLFQKDSAVFDGYNLFMPTRATTAYLIDNFGREIHRWETGYLPGFSVYLLENGDLLCTGRLSVGPGHGGLIRRLDWDGSVLWEYQYFDSTVLQHHDIEPMPNGNVLLIAWENKTPAEAIAAGRNPTVLMDSLSPLHIVEVEPNGPDTGDIVWEWHLWDHLIQDHDATKDNYGVVADHPELVDINFPVGRAAQDWVHSNSVAYNPDLDQILVSCRAVSEIWIIDHSTTTEEAAGHTGGTQGKGGDLLYRWGNPIAYRAGTADDQQYIGQHDAMWVPPGYPGEGNITVFNNGVGRPEGNYSTVDEIIPPVDGSGAYDQPTPGTAFAPTGFTWSYAASPPALFYSAAISGAQRLPNGNTLICEGDKGHFFEVTESGDVVWDYINPVQATGHLTQGDSPISNQVFRVRRYARDYPGLAGRDLTPGAPLELNPLTISGTAHTPSAPDWLESVGVTTLIESGDVASVGLFFDTGAGFSSVAMLDDGNHGDGASGDGLYGASIPPSSLETHVTYYVLAESNTADTVLDPPSAPSTFYSYTVGFGCCLPPTAGDCDQSGAVDITDISVLVDNQFLTLAPLACPAEGDIDHSGEVDITDLSVLIDNQFLTLTPLPPCP